MHTLIVAGGWHYEEVVIGLRSKPDRQGDTDKGQTRGQGLVCFQQNRTTFLDKIQETFNSSLLMFFTLILSIKP